MGELDTTERISLQMIVAGLLLGPIVGFLYLFSVLGSGPRTYEWVTAPDQSGGRQVYPLTGVYGGLLFLLPGASLRPLAIKLFVDQVVQGPLMIGSMFCWCALANGDDSS